MELAQFLISLKKEALKQGVSEPFLVGGVPRDKVIGILDKIEDLDITTGDSSIHKLADFLGSKPGITNFKKMPDGHVSLNVGTLKFDFSSNYVIPDVSKIVDKKLSPLEEEMFSRDFTCNALLLSLDMKKIKDPTGRGITDIGDGILETPLEPEITLGMDNKRVIRAIYLACKLDFDISERVYLWIKNNPGSVARVPASYLKNKINDCFKHNKERALGLFNELGLTAYLPLDPSDSVGVE